MGVGCMSQVVPHLLVANTMLLSSLGAKQKSCFIFAEEHNIAQHTAARQLVRLSK